MSGTTKDLPSLGRLHQLFTLDPERGLLIWRERNRNLTGRVAGGVDPGHGYRRVRIDGQFYQAHRVVLAMASGRWPEGEVDHINGNRDDNRPSNLREVARAENLRNKARYRSNRSGRTGVHWHRQHRKWCAAICVGGKARTLGVFHSLEAAIAAREAAERELDFHPNHGRAAR